MNHLDTHGLQILEIGTPDQEVVGNKAHLEPVPQDGPDDLHHPQRAAVAIGDLGRR